MAKLNFKVPQFRAPVDIAHAYIAAGVPVFPCHESEVEEMDPSTGEFIVRPEKSPYTSNGLKGATRSARIIDIWFGERHPSAVIGVPTGEPLGAWVLDLDRHGDRDGHTWLAEMEAKHGPLPETARATTANGGTHVFFRHVDGVRNRAAIAPGVDTRGQDGYIVGPGSIMADGRTYAWENHDDQGMPEFADAPQWLLDLVIAKAPERPANRTDYTYTSGTNERYVERSVEDECRKVAGAAIGNRGHQLFASACALGEFVAGGHISRADAESELYAAAVSSGVAAKDGDKATWDRIRRGMEKGKGSPRQIPEPEYHNDNSTTQISQEQARRFLEKTAAKQAAKDAPKNTAADEQTDTEQESADQPEETPAEQPAPKPKRERFELTWFDEIEEGAPKETIIKGALGAAEFTTISGLPGTGKSVIVTDMACHIAAGMDWHGRKIKQGLVIYVAAERKKLTERRMMAFRKERGVKDVPLLVIGGRLDFTRDLKDARDLIKVIQEAEVATGQKCVWVIIDTLTRVFGAGDQNASKDMSKFVNSCDEILAETKAHVTAIHHSAWSGERGKGAIDLDGAVDASFMVKKDHGKYRLVCDGTNDGEEGDILTFTMKSVQLGIDEDGEPTTAPVVVPATGDDAVNGLVESSTWTDKAYALLVSMQPDGVVSPGTTGLPKDCNIVDREAWRQAFYEDMGDALQSTKQGTFNRSYKKLLKRGQIGECGTWIWPLE